MTDGSVAIGATVRAGLSGLGPALRACWLALAVAALLGLTGRLLPQGLDALAGPIELIAMVVAGGAVYRRAFQRPTGLIGLRWGVDEWRLLATQLLKVMIFLVILSVLALVVAAVTIGVARISLPGFDATSPDGWREALANAGVGGFVVGLVPLLSLAMLVWLAARLSLSGPATVEQGGVRVLSSIPLTRGIAPQLLAAGFILALPLILLGAAFTLLGPHAGPGLDLVRAVVSALTTYFYLAPVWAVALAHVYRRRRSPDAPLSQDA